jgi:hypothetical protein
VSCDTRRIYRTDHGRRSPAPLLGPPGEPVVDRIVQHVLDRGFVLLLGFDQLRPEAPPEDMVLPAVPFVEGACVAAVEVAHPVREVRTGCLHYQVVVVAHQAGDVDAPPVSALDPSHDVGEDHAVPVVQDDRSLVVAARRDVVIRAGLERSKWPSHPIFEGSGADIHRSPRGIL